MPVSDAPKKPYHHGDLREALIDAAEGLLAEGGIEKLSLRSAARRSGVSQAAPYAHFIGKQALLAALATRGFERLTDYLQRADKQGDAAAERRRLIGRAYVAFALDQPSLFRLMFGPEICKVEDEALAQAGMASYAPIQAAVAEEAATVNASDQADDASMAAWALVHGLATLIVDGKQPWPDTELARDDLVDRVVSVYSIPAMHREDSNGCVGGAK